MGIERTASRPSPRGGANWAVFFAPLAVTAVVVLGAMVFVWDSEPDPTDSRLVERLELGEVESVDEAPRFASVKEVRAAERRGLGEDTAARPAGVASNEFAGDSDDEEEDSSDVTNRTSDRKPEERRVRERTFAKFPFMASALERIRQRRAGVGDVGPEDNKTSSEASQDGDIDSAPEGNAPDDSAPEGNAQDVRAQDGNEQDAAAWQGAAGSSAQ